MAKYYYLDENNNKVYYAGEIIHDSNSNQIYGNLTKFKDIKKKIELEFHEAQEESEGWSSYFTYKDENNNMQIYQGNPINIKKSFNGSYFVSTINTIEIPVIKHPEIKKQDAYFTYMNENGEEIVYSGSKKPIYDKKTHTYFIYDSTK